MRLLPDRAGMHFAGLQVASRHFRRTGSMGTKTAKKLAQLDVVSAWLRHVTVPLVRDLVVEVAGQVQEKSGDTSRAGSNDAAKVDAEVQEEQEADEDEEVHAVGMDCSVDALSENVKRAGKGVGPEGLVRATSTSGQAEAAEAVTDADEEKAAEVNVKRAGKGVGPEWLVRAISISGQAEAAEAATADKLETTMDTTAEERKAGSLHKNAKRRKREAALQLRLAEEELSRVKQEVEDEIDKEIAKRRADREAGVAQHPS